MSEAEKAGRFSNVPYEPSALVHTVWDTDDFIARQHELFAKSHAQFEAFGGPCTYFHRECLSAGAEGFLSNGHIEMLYATLTSWGMHRMGGGKAKTKLTEWSRFHDSIKANASRLEPFRAYSMLQMSGDDYLKAVGELRPVYESLALTETQAVIWGLVERNTAEHISMPRVAKAELTMLTVEQGQKLVEAASAVRNGSIFTVAMAVGLRIGEACGLRWQDVDLDAKTLRVVQAVEWRSGKASLGEPKSDSSRRTVRLPEFAVEALKKHRARQREDKLAAGKDWVDTGLVFTSTKGTTLDYANVHKEFTKLLGASGLPKVRLHDLRHTCATILMAQGVGPKVVMETLGHSQVNLTLGTYSHVSAELQKIAATAMDEVFRSA